MYHQESLNQYGSRCEWLKDEKFLRDLEGDSVDTEILDEELRSLQEDEPKTCRGKTIKFLESNPFQIVLCVLVLVDAGVVVSEILLDLHAIRGQLTETHLDLLQALSYLRHDHDRDLGQYSIEDTKQILDILKQKYSYMYNETRMDKNESEIAPVHMAPVNYHSVSVGVTTDAAPGAVSVPDTQPNPHRRRDTRASSPPPPPPRLTWDTPSPPVDINLNNPLYIDSNNNNNKNMQRDVQHGESPGGGMRIRHASKRLRGASDVLFAPESPSNPGYARVKRESAGEAGLEVNTAVYDPDSNHKYEDHTDDYHPIKSNYKKKESYSKKLLKIAHILHYCSICILGVFVLQLLFRMYGMGCEFFKKKMEIFDGIIILASFALDLVFLEGIVGASGEEAAALLILFLLWRLLRVINGIMITAKKRQEFRIKLQKRARRRAEKKIENLEEERTLKDKEINALRDICKGKGVTDQECNACRPRRRSMFHKLDTSAGLSSIASLSLGLSMSMTGAAVPDAIQPTRSGGLSTAVGRRESLQDFMMGLGMPGLALPAGTPRGKRSGTPNRLAVAEPSPRSMPGKLQLSMERVEEESSPEESPVKKPLVLARTTPNGSSQTGRGTLHPGEAAVIFKKPSEGNRSRRRSWASPRLMRQERQDKSASSGSLHDRPLYDLTDEFRASSEYVIERPVSANDVYKRRYSSDTGGPRTVAEMFPDKKDSPMEEGQLGGPSVHDGNKERPRSASSVELREGNCDAVTVLVEEGQDTTCDVVDGGGSSCSGSSQDKDSCTSLLENVEKHSSSGAVAVRRPSGISLPERHHSSKKRRERQPSRTSLPEHFLCRGGAPVPDKHQGARPSASDANRTSAVDTAHHSGHMGNHHTSSGVSSQDMSPSSSVSNSVSLVKSPSPPMSHHLGQCSSSESISLDSEAQDAEGGPSTPTSMNELPNGPAPRHPPLTRNNHSYPATCDDALKIVNENTNQPGIPRKSSSVKHKGKETTRL